MVTLVLTTGKGALNFYGLKLSQKKARNFSWEKTAEETVKVYQAVEQRLGLEKPTGLSRLKALIERIEVEVLSQNLLQFLQLP